LRFATSVHGHSLLHRQYQYPVDRSVQGRQSWRLGVETPRFGAGGRGGLQGVAEGREGSWTGREILLYLIIIIQYM